MTFDLRFANRLREEASDIRELARGALNAGDVEEYDRLCAREARLVRASGWAAVEPTTGEKIMRDHGLELRSREADTQPMLKLEERQGVRDEASGKER